MFIIKEVEAKRSQEDNSAFQLLGSQNEMAIEGAMEEMLRYQVNVKRGKYNKIIVDLKYLDWWLKNSNPSFWRDNSKKVQVKSNLVKNGNVSSIDNHSGFTLTEAQKESNN